MDMDKAITSIEKQLKEFVGDKKAIIGLSGGIDSTVIAYLCERALGKENVVGISMPCYGVSSESSKDDAVLVATALDIPFKVRGIGDAVKAFKEMETDGVKDLTLGNVMARVRMVTLYMYANELGGMVIGTTNKTEAAIGYYTKYGDGAVDVEPIAGLYKTEVWEMAKVLGVPQNIIDKKPSAELWEGHSDEDELGMTYVEMDAMLEEFTYYTVTWYNKLFFKDKYMEKMLKKFAHKYSAEKAVKLLALVSSSKHKKNMPPAFDIE